MYVIRCCGKEGNGVYMHCIHSVLLVADPVHARNLSKPILLSCVRSLEVYYAICLFLLLFFPCLGKHNTLLSAMLILSKSLQRCALRCAVIDSTLLVLYILDSPPDKQIVKVLYTPIPHRSTHTKKKTLPISSTRPSSSITRNLGRTFRREQCAQRLTKVKLSRRGTQ